MATGDAAAAKGLRTVPPSEDLREGYDAINERGDELAQEIDDRAAADATLDAEKFDAANIFVQATAPANIPGTGYSGRLWFKKA